MRKTKALLALATATSLLFSSMTAFAADDVSSNGTVSGTGNVQEFLDTDVFSVVAPTISNVNFTMDPQGLLGVANSVSFGDGEGAVYFAVSENDTISYGDTSDDILG